MDPPVGCERSALTPSEGPWERQATPLTQSVMGRSPGARDEEFDHRGPSPTEHSTWDAVTIVDVGTHSQPAAPICDQGRGAADCEAEAQPEVHGQGIVGAGGAAVETVANAADSTAVGSRAGTVFSPFLRSLSREASLSPPDAVVDMRGDSITSPLTKPTGSLDEPYRRLAAELELELAAEPPSAAATPGATMAASKYRKGLDANRAGDTPAALTHFLEAVALQPRKPSYALSAANMMLKVEPPWTAQAIELYERVQQLPRLTEKEAAMARTKLADAAALQLEARHFAAAAAAARQAEVAASDAVQQAEQQAERQAEQQAKQQKEQHKVAAVHSEANLTSASVPDARPTASPSTFDDATNTWTTPSADPGTSKHCAWQQRDGRPVPRQQQARSGDCASIPGLGVFDLFCGRSERIHSRPPSGDEPWATFWGQ